MTIPHLSPYSACEHTRYIDDLRDPMEFVRPDLARREMTLSILAKRKPEI